LLERSGLAIVHLNLGHWSTRVQAPNFQDIVVVTRPQD
jgi:hypothetical protein